MSGLTKLNGGTPKPAILSREEVAEIEALIEEYPDPRAASIEHSDGSIVGMFNLRRNVRGCVMIPPLATRSDVRSALQMIS